MECEVRSVECKVWSEECGVCKLSGVVECGGAWWRVVDGVWSAEECKVWSAKCKVWSVKCGMWSEESKV